MWCIPGDLDEQYLLRMEDILDLYNRPYNPKEPVLCLDEKPVMLHEDIRAPRPARPGHIRKTDSEYKRRGSVNVFCAVEPLSGKHFVKPTRSRTAREYAKMIAEIARRYPGAHTIHLVQDNVNIHGPKSLIDCYGPDDGLRIWNRFTVHYTPKHGSRLNQAEILIGKFSRECLGKLRIPSFEDLQKHVRPWLIASRRKTFTINWYFNTKEAREKFHYRRGRRGVLFKRCKH